MKENQQRRSTSNRNLQCIPSDEETEEEQEEYSSEEEDDDQDQNKNTTMQRTKIVITQATTNKSTLPLPSDEEDNTGKISNINKQTNKQNYYSLSSFVGVNIYTCVCNVGLLLLLFFPSYFLILCIHDTHTYHTFT